MLLHRIHLPTRPEGEDAPDQFGTLAELPAGGAPISGSATPTKLSAGTSHSKCSTDPLLWIFNSNPERHSRLRARGAQRVVDACPDDRAGLFHTKPSSYKPHTTFSASNALDLSEPLRFRFLGTTSDLSAMETSRSEAIPSNTPVEA